MRSRALRVTLTLLAIAALGVAAYRVWTIEMAERERRAAASFFSDTLTNAHRDAAELRAAQQAYVAEGQSEGYWFDKVTAASEALRARIGELDAAAPTADAKTAIGQATTALRTFEGFDRRARGYAATGQKLLASDVIYGDSLAAVTTLIGSLDSAGHLAEASAATAAARAQREQLLYLAGSTGGLLIALLLLTPRPDAPEPPAKAEPESAASASPAGLDLDLQMSPPRRGPHADPPARAASKASAAAPSAPPAPSAPAAPFPDLQALATVCTDLAKLEDTDSLPGILERTARTLDASGLVLWVADYAGAELVPVATHGYPSSVLSRLGTISREAANATGAAFRTGLVQTVAATSAASGAIAAPLMTPSGCRGVLSAEVRGAGAEQPAKLAAAAIVAAQLSALVGPPAAAAQDVSHG